MGRGKCIHSGDYGEGEVYPFWGLGGRGVYPFWGLGGGGVSILGTGGGGGGVYPFWLSYGNGNGMPLHQFVKSDSVRINITGV